VNRSVVAIAIVGVCLGAVEAGAGSFFLPQQSIPGLGRAFAGGAAVASDASTVFTNPAGMTELLRAESASGGNVFVPKAGFTDGGSTAATVGGGFTTVPYAGSDGGNPFTATFLPNLYVAHPLLADRLWLGLGLTVPFGLGVEYDNGWFGRYDAVKSELRVVNIGPAAAYRVTDWLSLGAGVDVQYADAKLTNAVPNVLMPVPAVDTDGFSELAGDDWSVGFNAGILVKPLPDTRVGVHYRSQVSHTLTGANTISGFTGPLAAANGRRSGTTELDLPDIVSVGFAHAPIPALTLLAEVQWFNWSRYREVRLRFDDGSADIVLPQDYDDSFAVSVGADYALTDELTLRAGFRYDTTPTVDRFRTAGVPDADSYAIAFGVTYRLGERLAFDLSYYHARWQDIVIDLDRTFSLAAGVSGSVNVKATGESYSNIVGLNLRYRF
jgi:long-chain fatty acid transport protein